MPVEPAPEMMWTLSNNRKSVRFHILPVPILGLPERLRLHVDFDAEALDEAMQRLTVLRAQMLPAPKHN